MEEVIKLEDKDIVLISGNYYIVRSFMKKMPKWNGKGKKYQAVSLKKVFNNDKLKAMVEVHKDLLKGVDKNTSKSGGKNDKI